MQKGRRNTSQQSEFDPPNIKHWSQENRLVSILKQDLEYKLQDPSVPGAWGWENLEKSSLAAAAGLVLLCCRVLAVLASLPPSSKCQIKLGEVDLMWRDCDWTTQLVRSRDRKAAKKGWSEYFGTWDWLVEKKTKQQQEEILRNRGRHWVTSTNPLKRILRKELSIILRLMRPLLIDFTGADCSDGPSPSQQNSPLCLRVCFSALMCFSRHFLRLI